MAAKKMGSITSMANIAAIIYTVPSGMASVFNINVCNASEEDGTIILKVGGDIIEFNTALNIGGVLERTGLIAGAGETIEIKSDIDGIVFRAYGIEE